MSHLQRLAIAALLVAGCGGRPVQHGAGAAPASVARVMVIAPQQPAPEPEPEKPPEPTAEYASLAAARDAIDAIVRRTFGTADTAYHISRESVTFEYWYVKATVRAQMIRVAVNDTVICPQDELLDAIRAAGWVEDWSHGADGPDGSVLGLVTRKFMCVVEGRWHGYDDSDSTYIPPPGCIVTATVVPRRADDTPDR